MRRTGPPHRSNALQPHRFKPQRKWERTVVWELKNKIVLVEIASVRGGTSLLPVGTRSDVVLDVGETGH